jgi:hypothetical protein
MLYTIPPFHWTNIEFSSVIRLTFIYIKIDHKIYRMHISEMNPMVDFKKLKMEKNGRMTRIDALAFLSLYIYIISCKY